MWYEKYTFYNKEKGLQKDQYKKSNDYFSDSKFLVSFVLPTEFLELLEYSNSGGIINGKREFQYFSLKEIEEFYLGYEFDLYTPLFLPIALNGGGVFYAYDFRDVMKIYIVAVSSSNLEYESSVLIGKSLDEVLSKTNNIEDELNTLYPKIEQSENDKKLINLHQQLRELEKEKNNITLKDYLLSKRKLEKEIDQLKI